MRKGFLTAFILITYNLIILRSVSAQEQLGDIASLHIIYAQQNTVIHIIDRSNESIYGCWDQIINRDYDQGTSNDLIVGRPVRSACISKKLVYTYEMGRNGFGESKVMEFSEVSSSEFKLDDQICAYLIKNGALTIKNCSLEGSWTIKCLDLNKEKDFCK